MNDFGQLGLGPDAARIQKNIEPREIHQLRDYAKQIACGLVHSQILLCKKILALNISLLENGRVVSFGDNQFG